MAIIGKAYFFLKKAEALAEAVLHAITIALQSYFSISIDIISSHLSIIASSLLSPYGQLAESLK